MFGAELGGDKALLNLTHDDPIIDENNHHHAELS